MLAEQITAYLQSPFTVINAPLATALAAAGQQRLTQATGLTDKAYSLAACLGSPVSAVASSLAGSLGPGLPRLELPALPQLAAFYEEHGLEPLSATELTTMQAANKLRRAWALLAGVPAVEASLRALVKTVQVVRSSDPEIDVSYTHPAVPFTVLVSVGPDASPVSSLRVAESLLHEAMHLKLTLLEQEVAIVKPESQRVYYSPWRDEERPVRGVLHGMFVFAAIREFYGELGRQRSLPSSAQVFAADRVEAISAELAMVKGFIHLPDLTVFGKRLAVGILTQEKAVENPSLLPKKGPLVAGTPLESA